MRLISPTVSNTKFFPRLQAGFIVIADRYMYTVRAQYSDGRGAGVDA